LPTSRRRLVSRPRRIWVRRSIGPGCVVQQPKTKGSVRVIATGRRGLHRCGSVQPGELEARLAPNSREGWRRAGKPEWREPERRFERVQ
jgi:hypothetical protein